MSEHSTQPACEKQGLPAPVPHPANRHFKDITGQTFGRLTVRYYVGRRPGVKSSFWLCRCVCGRHTVVRAAALRNGNTRSCGCLSAEAVAKRMTTLARTHGMRNSPEYAAWRAMLVRCHTPTAQAYHNYGARGVHVCDRWRHSFENFYADMGPRPSPDHSIDRINNEAGYSPDNCRWATLQQQAVNKRTNVYLEYDGHRLTVAEWSRRVGIAKWCIRARLRAGWTVVDALTRPPRVVQRRGGHEG